MKTQFAWYLGSSPQQAEVAWKMGSLTVDANVLLDLYRYHTSTCQSILAAIETFGPRVWMSHQAASEFFANRKAVIASSEKTFRDADSAIDELSKSVDGAVGKLRGYRLVPRPALDALAEALNAAVDQARAQIKDASSKHPNYLKTDMILERLLSLFDGKTGNELSGEARTALLKEAELRLQTKIPPGYMDDDKDGDRKHGDFLLWSQVMNHAKEAKIPLILVTSERKEDWWERTLGKTLGPRLEMIKEFYTNTGQHVHIYHTENFLKVAAERAGQAVTRDVVEEIREVNAERARQWLAHQPAVNVDQTRDVCENDKNTGALDIELLREIKSMTGSGRLYPQMSDVPTVTARVVSTPEGCPPLQASANTGTRFDFNVHVRCIDRFQRLPVGHYRIEYEANCNDEEAITSDRPLPALASESIIPVADTEFGADGHENI